MSSVLDAPYGKSPLSAGRNRERKDREGMLFHSFARLAVFPLLTANGQKRSIRGFLVDDRTWLIRYLVVEAGNWLAPRAVAVSTAATEVPDWKARCVPTSLTLEELLASPPAETVRPVSRQQELAWSRHFGWPEQDGSWHIPAMAARREFGGNGEDDPHLRRMEDVKGYQVWGRAGSIGQLEGYLMRDRSWQIGYLVVRAGEWVYREQLVATRRVCAISWGEHRVLLEGAAGAPRGCGDEQRQGSPAA